jgi:selenide, water dikinase
VKRLLLLGCGHAHLEVVRQFGQRRPFDFEVECVLANPDQDVAYSGMLPGVVAGHYAQADMLIDVAALADAGAWRFIPHAVRELVPTQRIAILADGSQIAYDILSLNTGSVTNLQQVPGAAVHAVPVRPFAAFLAAWQNIREEAEAGQVSRIAVVGAGAGGVEIALAMAHRLSRSDGFATRCGVVLVSDAVTILAGYPPAVQDKFKRLLSQRGVAVHCGSLVTQVESGAIKTASGEVIAADRVVWATAGAAPDWLQGSGIATDSRGFIAVDRHLRSLSNAGIFGGGDVVSAGHSPHPKSGVYAVRHGPVLAANLRAALDGSALRSYLPQRNALSLISAGDRYAVASWNRWSVTGNWVWSWKDRIDRAFVARYRNLQFSNAT